MPSIQASDGVRLDYTEHGTPNGRPVVLLAGFKAPATSWAWQLSALENYRVFAVDLRGHGTSEHPEAGASMQRRGEDVRDVLENLGVSDVILIGGSLGGNTIWSYIDQFGSDRVRAAIIVDQTPKMMNTAHWSHGYYGYDESNAETPTSPRGSPPPVRAPPCCCAGCVWLGCCAH